MSKHREEVREGGGSIKYKERNNFSAVYFAHPGIFFWGTDDRAL